MARSKFVLPALDANDFTKPIKLASLPPFVGKFTVDLLEKVAGLDYWQLKRVGLNMKRFAKKKAMARSDTMEYAWKLIDVDGSGSLDFSELQTLLGQMKMPCEDDDVTAIMQEIDTDQSGSVDHDEFSGECRQTATFCAAGVYSLGF
jgi:hypothetical protein